MNVSYHIDPDPQEDPDGRWFAQAKLFYDLGGDEIVHCTIRSEKDPSFDTEDEAAAYGVALANKFLRRLVEDSSGSD